MRGVCCRLEVSYFRLFPAGGFLFLSLVPGTDELLRTAYGGFSYCKLTAMEWNFTPVLQKYPNENELSSLSLQARDLVSTCNTDKCTTRNLIYMYTYPGRKFWAHFPEFPPTACLCMSTQRTEPGYSTAPSAIWLSELSNASLPRVKSEADSY